MEKFEIMLRQIIPSQERAQDIPVLRQLLFSEIFLEHQYLDSHTFFCLVWAKKSLEVLSISLKCSTGDNLTPGEIWFQVHLVPKRTVFGITTQGRPRNGAQWMTKYKVAYSNDGVTWTTFQSGGADKVRAS